MILGGSTNAVLHLIAIAHSVGISLTIDDFQSVSDRIPFIADLKPSGKYVMEDVYKIGGIPGSSFSLLFCLPFRATSLPPRWRLHSFSRIGFLGLSAFVSIPSGKVASDRLSLIDLISFAACAVVLHYLLKNKLIDGSTLTVTGKTLGENLERWVHQRGELSMTSQDVIRPLEKPIKSTGHLRQVRPFQSLRMIEAARGARKLQKTADRGSVVPALVTVSCLATHRGIWLASSNLLSVVGLSDLSSLSRFVVYLQDPEG